jgi:hypothetical protein
MGNTNRARLIIIFGDYYYRINNNLINHDKKCEWRNRNVISYIENKTKTNFAVVFAANPIYDFFAWLLPRGCALAL